MCAISAVVPLSGSLVSLSLQFSHQQISDHNYLELFLGKYLLCVYHMLGIITGLGMWMFERLNEIIVNVYCF